MIEAFFLLLVGSFVLYLVTKGLLSDSYHSPAAAAVLSCFRGLAIMVLAALALLWSWEQRKQGEPPVTSLILIDESSRHSIGAERIRHLESTTTARGGRPLTIHYNIRAGSQGGVTGSDGPGLPTAADATPIAGWLAGQNPDLSVAIVSDFYPQGLVIAGLDGNNISWIHPDGPTPPDFFRSIECPQAVFPDRPFKVRTSIRNDPAATEVTLSVNGVPVGNRRLSLISGPWEEITFPMSLDRHGINDARLAVMGKDGVVLAAYSLHINVLPVPRILLYSPMGAGSPLAGHLSRNGIKIDHLSTQDLISGKVVRDDSSPENDLIVIDSAPASYFNSGAAAALSDAVRRLGYSLIVMPGAGISPRDRGTPLERIMPVKLGLEEKDDPGTDLAFVAIVDTSLSMFFTTGGVSSFAHEGGGLTTKIEMAKKAILNLAQAVRESDRLGVLTVTDSPSWVIRPSEPRDPGREEEVISRIGALGPGINLYSALLAAYNELITLDSDLKHILIFLDTADVDEYQVADLGTVWELLEDLQEQGITVSLIGFGKAGDPHIPQLNRFAEESGGYFYLTSDILEIPGFGIMDLDQVAETLLNYRARKVNFFSADFPGVEEFPDLNGQVITTLKPGATLYAWSDRDLPLFAAWPLGEGKVGAFTADGGQSLARGWNAVQEGSSPWLSILARFLSDDLPETGLYYFHGEAGGNLLARVESPERGEDLQAVAFFPDGSTSSLGFEKVGLDRYEATLETPGKMPNAFELIRVSDGERLAYQTLAGLRQPQPTTAGGTGEFDPRRHTSITNLPDEPNHEIFRLFILLALLCLSLDEFFRPPSAED